LITVEKNVFVVTGNQKFPRHKFFHFDYAQRN